MPPFVPRKRDRSRSPAPASASKRTKKTVFDALDAPPATASSAADKAFLDALGSDSSDDTDSDGFEDVDIGNLKNKAAGRAASKHQPNGVDDGEDDDEMDWEDALPAPADTPTHATPQAQQAPWHRNQEDADDVLEVNLGGPVEGNDEIARRNALGIKGPSKKDRQLRIWTHCMHVQLLLWHNHIRNGWVCDREVQKLLLDQLPDGVKKEVQRWRRDSGLPPDESLEPEPKGKGKRGVNGTAKGKGKGKERSDRHSERNQRDWGGTAVGLEDGVPNLSQGDPLFRLLKYLAAYWKKRFRITAPGLRKKGYFPTAKSLGAEVKAWQATKEDSNSQKKPEKEKKGPPEEYDIERFGERIRSKADFLEAARRCEGSRDVGAQLFTALVRGLGLEARLVASLQPIGFGFTKVEEAALKKGQASQPEAARQEDHSIPKSETKAEETPNSAIENQRKPTPKAQKPVRPTARKSSGRKSGTKPLPANSDDDSDSSLSSARSDISDASVIEITPSKPVKRLSNKHYDTDLKYPIYWTEVLSPISNTWVPVSPLVISTVASTPDLISSFEPRGAAAEKAKQVICYIVAYSADGTAKDVTVRYLKKHIWPGKTKGFRMPVEKIPIYNKHGKVKRHEEFDWFKHVMSGYTRDGRLGTRADELEDAGDLVPIKPSTAKKADGTEPETLQAYKNSAEYVLQRHLRREEAIRPSAQPVKTFTAGKGDKAKPEPVFLRKDVVVCKTAESWHKEGRQILASAQPMKRVPSRAVTLARKREIEEAERESGERATQGLYAREQTEWIVPPPIVDGKIPRNAFGNIDVYVPTMVPAGAVHVPLRGTARLCKKLGIDFAEACTGFEFGRQMAVPVLTGVVVAEENAEVVREAWREDQRVKREKEEKKRREAALKMWRKFCLGLRVIERVREEYGEGAEGKEEINPFARRKKEGEVGNTFERRFGDEFEDEGEGEGGGGGGFLPDGDPGPGGFFPPGHEEEDAGEGGFIRDDGGYAGEGGFVREEEDDVVEGGGFIIEGDDRKKSQDRQDFETTGNAQDAPFSLQSAHQNLSKDVTDDAEENPADDDEEKSPPPKKKPAASRPRGATTRGRGRGRGRGTAPTRGRASRGSDKRSLDGTADDDDNNDSQPPSATSSESEASPSPAPALNDDDSDSASDVGPRRVEETPRQRAPQRAAARKSATAVRSHYFDDDDDGDGGEKDEESEGGEGESVDVEEQPATRSGGGGRGRGRGRGRRRGRGRGKS